MINERLQAKISDKIEKAAPKKASSDLEQVRIDFAKLLAKVGTDLAISNTDAVQNILGSLQQKVDKRIFEDGLDSYNRQIGIYSEEYAKKRREVGLQGGRVVLIFTGQMREAMYLEDNDQISIEFEGQFAEDKSRWVQKTYFTDIFELTDDEESYLNELIDETADKIWQQEG